VDLSLPLVVYERGQLITRNSGAARGLFESHPGDEV